LQHEDEYGKDVSDIPKYSDEAEENTTIVGIKILLKALEQPSNWCDVEKLVDWRIHNSC